MLPEKTIQLQKIIDPRGNLTVVQSATDIPFPIQRVYWLYDVPSGESRGGHAHKHCKEMIVALSGSFHVTLNDGKEQKTYLMSLPNQALMVDAGIWRTLDDFSSGAVCLVLASEPFDEDDYIREYDEFIDYVNHQ